MPEPRKAQLREHLATARTMLLFKPDPGRMHVLNPVSLSLVEALVRRKQFCESRLTLVLNAGTAMAEAEVGTGTKAVSVNRTVVATTTDLCQKLRRRLRVSLGASSNDEGSGALVGKG